MVKKLAQKGFNWKKKEGISVVCNTRKGLAKLKTRTEFQLSNAVGALPSG
jgi:hypothetical protein